MMFKWIGRLMAAAVICAAASASAQTYPNRVIKIIVPFGPGGITDIYARMLGEHILASTGQPVVVENRTGQGGSLGPAAVAKADPDGYTLLMGGSGNTIGQTMYKSLSFNIVTDFVPIVRTANIVNVLFVKKDLPAKNVAEVIALAKASPGKLQYASSGFGGVYHLAMEMVRSMSGTDILHVPYRAEGPARTDVVAGRMDMMISAYGIVVPNTQSGQVRMIGMTGPKRFSGMPDVPTIAETLPGYDGDSFIGLFAPAGTPQAAVQKIHDEVVKFRKRPEIAKRLTELGLSFFDETQAEFAKFVKDDVEKWKKIIEVSGTKTN